MIYRHVRKDGVETSEIVFIISRLPPKVRGLAKLERDRKQIGKLRSLLG